MIKECIRLHIKLCGPESKGHRVRYFNQNSYFEGVIGHQVRYLLKKHAK